MDYNPSARPPPASFWQRFSAASVRWFHAYATWLVGISWWRFALLALLLLVCSGILSSLPPFTWTITTEVHTEPAARAAAPQPPQPPEPATASTHREPLIKIEKGISTNSGDKVEISIDEKGIRIRPGATSADRAAEAASAAASAAVAAASAAQATHGINITLPPGPVSEAVREAVDSARDEIKQAIDDANQAVRDAEEARRDAQQAAADAAEALNQPHTRIERVSAGEFLPQFAFLWIVASIIIKSTYKSRIQAEVKAAQATEVAESESLKRQVVEARMAAMQAQVEPHFLFNTLASIDHLIETDPPRASLMQKNLIALLRASMPTLREANDGGLRELGREIGVIRPYLEILKVRMEERLTTEIDVPEGLLSAQFPPMMIQTLVENAVKHGLEPKPEGGRLLVKAEIVHGKLAVTVADTGLGFGKAATAGTGIGLANIRERLQLRYGQQGSVTISENQPSGTRVTIAVPYQMHSQNEAVAA